MSNVFLTLSGLLICLTPFILVKLYTNRIKGFLTIFTTLAAVHVLTALITQSLGIFFYGAVLAIHIVVATYALCFFWKKHKAVHDVESISTRILFKNMAANWFLLALVILGSCLLYSIRFNYSGMVDTALGVKRVSQSLYTYPQYSDEWVGSSLVSYSIRNRELPLVNPLNNNEPFINFLAGSHASFAEVILVLGLNPLSQYIYLAIMNGILISLGVYLVLRLLVVRRDFAGIAALSVLLITNSGNLPGLWYIVPYTASLTFLIFSIAGFLSKNRFAEFGCLLISLVLYPPMILFAVPFLFATSYVSSSVATDTGSHPNWKKVRSFVLRTVAVLVLAFGLLLLSGSRAFSLSEIFARAYSFIVRESLDLGKVSYKFWNIVPIFLIPFMFVGLYDAFVFRKRVIMFPALVGIFFWLIYGTTRMIFLMEPSRVIVITSVLLVILAGIGLEKTYGKVQSRFDLRSDVAFAELAKVLAFVFLAFWIALLPKLGLWHKLPMAVQLNGSERLLVPAPPLTRYLTTEDLQLFSTYKEKRFISDPWKGLVVGAATQNYPLDSKSSTLTNKILRYETFIGSSCDQKFDLIKKYKIDLVYSSKIECLKGSVLLGKSTEGFFLYDVSGISR